MKSNKYCHLTFLAWKNCNLWSQTSIDISNFQLEKIGTNEVNQVLTSQIFRLKKLELMKSITYWHLKLQFLQAKNLRCQCLFDFANENIFKPKILDACAYQCFINLSDESPMLTHFSLTYPIKWKSYAYLYINIFKNLRCQYLIDSISSNFFKMKIWDANNCLTS